METLRDVVIIIAGLLFIILTLGMLIGGFVLYRKIRRTIQEARLWFRRLRGALEIIKIVREVFKPSPRKTAKAKA